MDSETHTFCEMIRNRSGENKQAMDLLSVSPRVLSPKISILRQELDSMIRVIYLLSLDDLSERRRLIQSTLRGEDWKVRTPKGRLRKITDREMVDLSQRLQGWTRSVYEFGCSFIHLSNLHNHLAENPFERLPYSERQNVISHLRQYQGGPPNDNPDLHELISYLPEILSKISSNLESYLGKLERDETTDI